MDATHCAVSTDSTSPVDLCVFLERALHSSLTYVEKACFLFSVLLCKRCQSWKAVEHAEHHQEVIRLKLMLSRKKNIWFQFFFTSRSSNFNFVWDWLESYDTRTCGHVKNSANIIYKNKEVNISFEFCLHQLQYVTILDIKERC